MPTKFFFVTTIQQYANLPSFRSNFDSTPPPILIDAGVAVLENEKIERHIMKNVPGGHNLFVQVSYLSTRVADLEFFPSRIRIKEFKYFNPKNCFRALGNMIWVVHPGSGSWLIFYPPRIPDRGVKKAPDPGYGSATLLSTLPYLTCFSIKFYLTDPNPGGFNPVLWIRIRSGCFAFYLFWHKICIIFPILYFEAIQFLVFNEIGYRYPHSRFHSKALKCLAAVMLWTVHCVRYTSNLSVG